MSTTYTHMGSDSLSAKLYQIILSGGSRASNRGVAHCLYFALHYFGNDFLEKNFSYFIVLSLAPNSSAIW